MTCNQASKPQEAAFFSYFFRPAAARKRRHAPLQLATSCGPGWACIAALPLLSHSLSSLFFFLCRHLLFLSQANAFRRCRGTIAAGRQPPYHDSPFESDAATGMLLPLTLSLYLDIFTYSTFPPSFPLLPRRNGHRCGEQQQQQQQQQRQQQQQQSIKFYMTICARGRALFC